ncbi:MAG: SDR family NAD(P)-dependent oxidoreductase, partial [Thermoanaerobaculia bacterium]
SIHILVNNAGFGILGRIDSTPFSELERMMQTNYFGAVNTTLAVLPIMKSQRCGAIVNVSSIAGIMGVAGMGGYGATKAALIGFTESLRDEVLRDGIRVSMICPGVTEGGEFFQSADRAAIPAASRLLRPLSPEDVARAIRRAIEGGSYRIILPAEAAIFMRLKEFFPRAAHFLMRVTSALLERKKP